jgi:hypothetical protein
MQLALASNFGSLSVSDFASAVSSLTGINVGAIQNFAQNWISFYTANPSATGSLSVTLAAYGAAFGDAVGVALLNPTADGTTALLVSEEQNALLDNAKGFYQVGIPLILEPPQLANNLIPDAGGAPFGPTIDWATQFGGANYVEFVDPAQSGPLTIFNAPSTFTLDTQHFATNALHIDAAGNNGNLCTLIAGDSTAGEDFGLVNVNGYATVDIVANGAGENVTPFFGVSAPAGSNAHLVISGGGFLGLGAIRLSTAQEGVVSVAVNGGTITDDLGGKLALGVTDAETIDASNAPLLYMAGPADVGAGIPGVTVLGGTSFNVLEGSLGGQVSTVTLPIVTEVSATIVGADNITGGSGGGDLIYGDGGPDTITLPSNHLLSDRVEFGIDGLDHVLIITDGLDRVYHGFWDVVAGGPAYPTAVPDVFLDFTTGGTSWFRRRPARVRDPGLEWRFGESRQ